MPPASPKPYEPDPRTAVARLYEIRGQMGADAPAMRAYRKYQTWIDGGGEVAAADTWGGAPYGPDYVYGHLVVFRKVGRHEYMIAAYKEMPLFVGDVLVTRPAFVAALELLTGGRVGIRAGTTMKILNEGEVGELVSRSHAQWLQVRRAVGIDLWAKFAAPEKPLTIQTRGGVMGGIKG